MSNTRFMILGALLLLLAAAAALARPTPTEIVDADEALAETPGFWTRLRTELRLRAQESLEDSAKPKSQAEYDDLVEREIARKRFWFKAVVNRERVFFPLGMLAGVLGVGLIIVGLVRPPKNIAEHRGHSPDP